MRLRVSSASPLGLIALFASGSLVACSSSNNDASQQITSALDSSGLTISSSLALSSPTVSRGATLIATVTYANSSDVPVVVRQAAIAGRPPGGTHGGGPYEDLAPYAAATTLAPGASFTIAASRAFTSDDALGTWTLYPTYQDDAGAWHDGPESSVDIVTTCTSSSGFSTSGNQILDGNGAPFRIASVGWNSFSATPLQGADANVAAIKQAGFNTIRISWVNARMDADLQFVDQVVAAASRIGVYVVLDNHTNEPGHGPQDNWGAQQKNGLWYDLGGATVGTDGGGNAGTVTNDGFLADWVTVARRYAGNAAVLGFDLRNEPLAYPGMSTWGDGNVDRDIRMMYERVGNAVLAVDPGKLIIAEGPQNYSGNFAGTGPAPWGDLSIAGSAPITLAMPHQLVYSIHDYPLEIAGFSPDNGAAKVALMNAAWGYLVKNNVAPVWVGELGSSMQEPTDAAWAQTMIDYLNGNDGAIGGPTFGPGQKGIGTDWWAWGYAPGDLPEGTQNGDGSLRSAQYGVYSQFR